ncbi:MAG: uroporphyrinogen-III synthase [Candidatus Dormibacteraceae bacterium]
MTGSLLLTRPAPGDVYLRSKLNHLGYRVHWVPTVAISGTEEPPPDLTQFDWVVVTSGNGVRFLLSQSTIRTGPRWATVGEATAAALARHGVRVEVVPRDARAGAIPAAMAAADQLAGRRVLVVRGDLADRELPERLRSDRAVVVEWIAYLTEIGPPESRPALDRALADPALAAVVLSSGSAAQGFVRLHPGLPQIAAITIGPRTSSEASALGFKVLAQARKPTPEALLEAVLANVA